jgi:hypothetical protein
VGRGAKGQAYFNTTQMILTAVKITLYLQKFTVCGSFFTANSNVMSVKMSKRMESGFATKRNFGLKIAFITLRHSKYVTGKCVLTSFVLGWYMFQYF